MRLSTSSRYYFGDTVDGKHVIRGEIIGMGGLDEPTIRIRPEFPVIVDGGCGVIHLSYDVELRTVISLHCNPDA